MEHLIKELLIGIGEDPDREGLIKTPERVARAWGELAGGYRQDPGTMVRGALFEAEGKEMIVVNDIDFYSMCEHHMLPFLRQGARGLHSRRQDRRSVEDRPGWWRPSPAGCRSRSA